MSETYNPIVRTFCQFRALILNSLDIDRREIGPDTRLESFLPIERRRRVWKELQRLGLHAPALEFSKRDQARTRAERSDVRTSWT